MSISGKNDIDWQGFRGALGDVPVIDKAPLIKRKSRDFFWYSPVLDRELKHCVGDLVAQPRSQEELSEVLKTAFAWGVPVTLRGGGTGNYGQAVPLEGGLIVEMTGLNRILEIGEDFVRAEAGCNIHKVNQALRENGRELPIFPSTERMATIGGFIGGGSSGIGSIEHGALRDKGNIAELTVLSLEASPCRHRFSGREVNDIHHAWGTNGVITEVTLKTAPTRDWINCIASFAEYRTAFKAGMVLGERDDLHRKLVSTVDQGICAHFAKLQSRIPAGRHLLLALIAREHLEPFERVIAEKGGALNLAMSQDEMAAADLPSIYEFAYNHTTLQVLLVDKSVTYLQAIVPAPIDAEAVENLRHKLGDEVMMHHEFARLSGNLVAVDLPVVRYSTDERLYGIIDLYEAHGFPVSDPHTCIIEKGGLKQADYRHLAYKKRLDPRGLLNPGKSEEWSRVKDMAPEAIEALQREQ